jgi:acetyl-CoA synthetase
MIPATTLLTRTDLRDRFARGRVRNLIATAGDAEKFEGLDPGLTRIAVGDAPAGWHRYDDLMSFPSAFLPNGETRASDPLLLYFTSGTTARPKLVLHSHQSYPVGHLSTLYVLGLLPGDVHLNISSPDWAKHAYSCFFAPWNAAATVFVANQRRFGARGMLDAIAANGVTTLCAPPTVWRMFVQEDLKTWKVSLREVCSAGEPLNPEVIEQVQAAWGLTVRDFYGQTETTSQVGNPPGMAVKPGSMGLALPGYRIRTLEEDDSEAGEGEVCIELDPRPTGLMLGYQQEDASLRRSAPASIASAMSPFAMATDT